MRDAYRRRVLTAPSHDSLAEGDRALLAGDWARAQAAFESVLAAGTSPEAWDGVAWAAWWQADEPLTLRARETAYRGYRAVGNHRAAGNVAAWLASDYREFRGETAVAAGWLRRAHRLLDPLPESAAHGWLAVNEVSFVLDSTADAAAASGLAERAARIGREHGVADLEAVGLAQQGITAVVQGRVEEGMRLLDEASVVASGEDLQTPLSRGWALCYLIAACDGVGDFPRAAEWCHAMREVGERWGSRQLVGVCRASYGRVLATSGDWVGAEGELLDAVGDLEASRPAQAPRGLARLGELRARQGRTDEARSLFERSGSAGVLGLASWRWTRATPTARPTPPSGCCGGCPPPRCSRACRRWSCWCARGPARAASRTPRRSAKSSPARARSSARRTSSAGSGSPRRGWRTQRGTSRRRGAPARTRSTGCPTAARRTTRRWPGSSWPAR